MKLKRNFLLLALALSLSVFASSESKQEALLKNYEHVYDLSDYTGQTFLSFMKSVVKSAIDEVVDSGYTMTDASSLQEAYGSLDKRVQASLEKSGGLKAAKKVAEALEGQVIYAETLPLEISKIDRKIDRYKMANYLGLLSGGGVVLRFWENNYAYNVHYDREEQKSGRSYGVGPTHLAFDASDKAYLSDVQSYYSDEEEEAPNLPEFYRTLLQSLLNTDTSNYPNITDEGQSLLSDFLAVYTAEQARNLMDNRVNIHWDAALLEVTLLGSFHAGQETFKLYYHDVKTNKVVFTDSVYQQTPCKIPEKTKKASMVDYWQFSKRIDDEKNCKRSGINVTKREFRKLESKITEYENKNHPELIKRLASAMNLKGKITNIYYDLSKYLINDRTDKELSENKVEKITEAWVDFLTQVTNDASTISENLK